MEQCYTVIITHFDGIVEKAKFYQYKECMEHIRDMEQATNEPFTYEIKG